MHGFMETYSRWDQVLTTSLWALTTVCRQRWGELTHNGSTKNDEDVWARGGSIPCLLLKGRMLSVWQCFLQTTWYFPSSFLIFSSSNSHPKFLPTHPKNQAFIGISAKKHISNFNYFHILSRWSSIGFKLPIAFPLSSNCSWTGHIFPRTRASWSMDHMTNWSFCDLRRFMMCKTDRNDIGEYHHFAKIASHAF